MWAPTKRSSRPTITGTSVLGVTFKGGVAIAADTLVSYNTLAKYRGCERVIQVNSATILGCGGDYADFQYLRRHIEQKVSEEELLQDGYELTPRSMFAWLTRVLYARRSRFNPLWVNVVVGGVEPDGEAFLGSVDQLGTAFSAPQVATGHAQYLALPTLRMRAHGLSGRQHALDLLAECMRTLYYRDARASSDYQMASVAAAGGVVLEGPLTVDANWDVAYMIREPR